jgi:hypothetical protein
VAGLDILKGGTYEFAENTTDIEGPEKSI